MIYILQCCYSVSSIWQTVKLKSTHLSQYGEKTLVYVVTFAQGLIEQDLLVA